MALDRSSGNIAIESFILGNEAYKWEHEFIKDEAVPYCDIENHKICSPIFGTIINDHDDMMVRGKNEHEAGHARLTPCNKDPKWSALKGNLVNALEDLRIERSIGKLSPMIEKDLNGLNQELNRSLCLKLSQKNHLKPIDEAILVMCFREHGLSVTWNVSPSAQKYVDAAYPEFMKWRDINNADNKMGFWEIEKIADAVIEKLEESAEQQNKEEQKGDKNSESDSKEDNQKKDNKQQKNNSSNSSEEQEDNNEESQNSGSSDEEGDGEEDNTESEEGDGDDTETGNNESNDSDSDDNESQSGSSKSEEGDADDAENDNSDRSDEMDNQNNAPQKEVGGSDTETKSLEKNCEEINDEKAKAKERLEKDFDNSNEMEEELSKKMEKIMEESKKISSGYTSFTANDIVIRGNEDKNAYEHARKRISSVVGQLSNYTEDAIKALSRVQYQRNLEHGKIDRRKLVGLSKSLTKKVFYKTTPGIDLNTAITIMIDESGSIGSMCYELRAMAIAFSEVFTKLGIKFEVLGFTTHGDIKYRTPRNVTRVAPIKIIEHKVFGETYQQAKYRLGTISSEYCNIDGESLLFAYKRIAKERVNRRIIFVLSDGLPNQGWGGGNITKHLYDSIKFVRKNGTEVYGFGIGTVEPQKFYGAENFLYLKSVSELGTSFFRRFREIVAK